jgi:transposase
MSEEAREVSTYSLVDTKEEIGADRRRRWPEALKRQIVAETRLAGASVSVVARRHDVNANQLFRWRRQYEARSRDSVAPLVPVTVQPSPRAAALDGTIEIELVSGARVRVIGAVDGAALAQVLEELK